jgi:hypothetical protein
VPEECRWDAVALEDPPDRRGTDTVAELEQLALEPHVPHQGFSRAIRTIGGRPDRFE